MSLADEFVSRRLTYLDECGYDEVEVHDDKEIETLYYEMYQLYAKPIVDVLKESDVYFNYFYRNDDDSVDMYFEVPMISASVGFSITDEKDDIIRQIKATEVM